MASSPWWTVVRVLTRMAYLNTKVSSLPVSLYLSVVHVSLLNRVTLHYIYIYWLQNCLLLLYCMHISQTFGVMNDRYYNFTVSIVFRPLRAGLLLSYLLILFLLSYFFFSNTGSISALLD